MTVICKSDSISPRWKQLHSLTFSIKGLCGGSKCEGWAFELSCQGSTVQKGIIYNRAFGYDTCARLGFKSQVIVRVYARVSAICTWL